MKNISEFFSRVQNKQTKELLIRKVVGDAILKITKITIPPESISFKGNAVALDGINQAEKSEIYIKKTAILAEIEKNLKTRKVTDIR